MRRRSTLAVLTLLLTLALPVGVAAQAPPAPTTRHQFRVDSPPTAGLAEVVTFLFDFAPGAATPPHLHPGLVLATVLEGALTFRTDGGERTYRVGESFIEPPGVVGTALNTGSERMRVAVSIQVPRNAPPSAPQPGGPTPAPPAPTPLYLTRADAVFPGQPYEMAQTVLDFGPGAATPLHTHPGQVFVTVLSGEITFTSQGTTRVFREGESFVERPGIVGQARNAGAAPASLMATYILPRGAALSTPIGAVGLPATGAASAGSANHFPTAASVSLLLGGLLLSGAAGVRRLIGRLGRV